MHFQSAQALTAAVRKNSRPRPDDVRREAEEQNRQTRKGTWRISHVLGRR